MHTWFDAQLDQKILDRIDSRSVGFCCIINLYLGNGEKASPGYEDQGHGTNK